MNTTRSTAPGMRLVVAALGATIATAGLGLCASHALADAETAPDTAVEESAGVAPTEEQAPAAPSTATVSALTAEQAADASFAGAQADAAAPNVVVELSNDAEGASQLYAAIDSLRAEAGLAPHVRDDWHHTEP